MYTTKLWSKVKLPLFSYVSREWRWDRAVYTGFDGTWWKSILQTWSSTPRGGAQVLSFWNSRQAYKPGPAKPALISVFSHQTQLQSTRGRTTLQLRYKRYHSQRTYSAHERSKFPRQEKNSERSIVANPGRTLEENLVGSLAQNSKKMSGITKFQ